ncbi:MAG: hypothetical protein LBJ00_08230 [Planctomycetaceae bacterium]|jgi:hypothetical protein|nr:hypothetical protein [Planctomycetaceae bacterium]
MSEVRQLEKLTGQKIFVSSGVRYYDMPTYIDETEQLNPRDATFLKAFTSVNFDAPDKSVVLRGVTSEADKVKALRIIQTGKERIQENGRNESEGFRYCEIDAWREAKYQQSRNRESEFRRAIVEGQKRYDSN